MNPPTPAESVDSVPKPEPDHISTKPAESADFVPKTEVRSITVVLRLSHFIILLIVMLVTPILLGKIYLEVNPFLDRYQGLSRELKNLEINLAKINETSEILKTELASTRKSFDANAAKIEDSNKNIQNAFSQIKELAIMIVDLKSNADALLIDQRKAGSEISNAVSNLKKEQESINMIVSQNNAIQSGIAVLIQRIKEAEVQIQAIRDSMGNTHRAK